MQNSNRQQTACKACTQPWTDLWTLIGGTQDSVKSRQSYKQVLLSLKFDHVTGWFLQTKWISQLSNTFDPSPSFTTRDLLHSSKMTSKSFSSFNFPHTSVIKAHSLISSVTSSSPPTVSWCLRKENVSLSFLWGFTTCLREVGGNSCMWKMSCILCCTATSYFILISHFSSNIFSDLHSMRI